MNRNHKVTRKVASKVYLCDVEKNKHCKGLMGERCQKECFCTTNMAYAVDPTHPLTNEELKAEWDKRHPEVEVEMPRLFPRGDAKSLTHLGQAIEAIEIKESEEDGGSETVSSSGDCAEENA